MRSFATHLLLPLGVALSASSFAADLDIQDASGFPHTTVAMPVVLSSATNLSLVTFEVTPDAALGAPEAVPGPDQANLLPADTFVDDLGGGVYRVTAYVVSLPNIGNGNVINLEFDLTGVPASTYTVALANGEFLDTANANATGALSGGTLTVNTGINAGDWMVIE